MNHGEFSAVEKKFQTNIVFICLRKVAIVSEDLILIGRSFKIVGADTEKARLHMFSFVLGTERCLETDDLWVLELLEKCSR